jgi:glycerol uptake facilitator-like aquaporin
MSCDARTSVSLAPHSLAAGARTGASPALARTPLVRCLAAEAVGTGYLLLAVVGSGIFGQKLAAAQPAVVLLVSALSTAAALYALIRWLGPVSGAHLNPVVSMALAWRGQMGVMQALAYGLAQTGGALLAVVLTHWMFEMPAFALSQTARHGPAQWLAESVATFGLVAAVLSCSRVNPSATAATVSTYVGAAFWFTPTDFVNPALTLARAFSDSFAGIRLEDVPGFWLAQFGGGAVALLFDRLTQDANGE